MNTNTILATCTPLKVVTVFYWKIHSDIHSINPDYITESLRTKKFIKEVIPHYSIPGQLTVTLKTKSTYSESEMKDLLATYLFRHGAENISITRI